MIGTLVGIIFLLIVLGVLWWAAKTLMALLPIEEPFKTIIYVIMVVIMVLIVVWVMWQLVEMSGIMGMSMSVPKLGH